MRMIVSHVTKTQRYSPDHTLNCQVSRGDRAIVDSHGTAHVDTLVLKLRVDDVQTSLASTRQLAKIKRK